jgi:hypothetical protein
MIFVALGNDRPWMLACWRPLNDHREDDVVGQATHCTCKRLHAGTRVYVSRDVGTGLHTYLAEESKPGVDRRVSAEWD